MAQASAPGQHIHDITAGPHAMVLAGTFHGCSFDRDDIATRRAKVLDYLRVTDPADDRAELQSQNGWRVPGTCVWIQSHPDYRKWLQGDCDQLWISGGPGTGKTMLSTFITESLEASKERVTYFFCRHDDERRNTEISVLRGLVVQLLRITSDQSFDQHVWPSFRSNEATRYTLSGPQTIWNVFQALVTSREPTPTFCILDGLDECDKASADQLTRRFHRLFAMNESTHSTATFRLAVVSRDPSRFRGFSNIQLKECDLQIRHDIRLFIASSLEDALSHKADFEDWVLWRLYEQLWVRSEGSFLWISFVVRDLLRYRTSREVMKALEKTPKGLGEQYRRIMTRIAEDHAEDWEPIRALLAWVALAFVPLTLPQLARAVRGSASLPHREHIRDLIIYCKDVLVFSDRTETVRLVHSSAKEFLVEPHPPNQPDSAAGRTHVDDGHRTIMRKCLKILEQTAKSDVLIPYAVQFLPQHMKACQAVDISRELARPFFTTGDILRRQWESWRLSQGAIRDIFPKATPSQLHIATWWGILPWAQQQLERRSRVLDLVLRRSYLETKDGSGMTPLAIAVYNEDVHMVEWLLQQGAIVHLEAARPEEGDGYWQPKRDSPLGSALVRGLGEWLASPKMEIASLLLSRLKKPTWRSILQSRALLTSCYNEDETIALWLLDQFPPPEKANKTYFACPALSRALRSGYVQLCEQLIDRGAGICSSCIPGHTAFSVAITHNCEADFPLLLERILNMLFDANEKIISTSGNGNHWDVLLQPVTHRYTRQCPAPFAPPDSFTFTSGHWSPAVDEKPNALALAAYYNKGLDLCLRRGEIGRLFDSGYSGRVELIFAVSSFRVEPVMMLLRKGAGVNAVDRHGKSVLTLAIDWGIWDVAQALISHGADVNFIGYGDITPLTEAVRETTLVPNPTDLSSVEDVLGFFSSFREQKLKTVSMLLDFGASPHCRTKAGETALSLAANLADADTVGILVERGARIAIGDQILDRGLWRWFAVFEILRMRGMLSNRCCSGLLAGRLQLLAKGRRLQLQDKGRRLDDISDWYYHFDPEFTPTPGRLTELWVPHPQSVFHVW